MAKHVTRMSRQQLEQVLDGWLQEYGLQRIVSALIEVCYARAKRFPLASVYRRTIARYLTKIELEDGRGTGQREHREASADASEQVLSDHADDSGKRGDDR
jgi:hypothetical protein